MSEGHVVYMVTGEQIANRLLMEFIAEAASHEAAKMGGRLDGTVDVLSPDDEAVHVEGAPEDAWVVRYGVTSANP